MPNKKYYGVQPQSLLHLTALKAFEAAARHGSFALAAQELGVTPAAVGQQVRILESWLGLSLFQRSKSGKLRLTPTVTAMAILPDITAGFERIRTSLEAVRQKTKKTLTVTASVAFVGQWLLTRVARFQALHPAILLRLDVTDHLADIGPGHADVGIRYGRGVWPGLHATRLLEDELVPVCSPRLLGDGIAELTGLLAYSLIHDLSQSDEGELFPGWAELFASQGLEKRETQPSIVVNATSTVIQAAVAGRGIALSRRALIASELEAGRLMLAAPGIRLALDRGWHLIHRPDALKHPQIAAFVTWALDEATC